LAFVSGLLLSGTMQATWSILAVDGATGCVAISSATCVHQRSLDRVSDNGLMGIQAIVVPGKGIAACQANGDGSGASQRFIFDSLQRGISPKVIMATLLQDPNVEGRQFGILDLQGRSSGFSGSRNLNYSLDLQGRVPGTQIYFAIQGNILASDAVVCEAARAFIQAKGCLADRVMLAMEAADEQGGDRRCRCYNDRHSLVAYLLLASPYDTSGSSFNDGSYSIYIDVNGQNILPTESLNPVKTLRMRYDSMMRSRKLYEA